MGSRGFTLIELSLVIGLVGLLALTSLPALTAFRERIYLETTSQQLLSDLRQTQAQAICSGADSSYDVASLPLPGGLASNAKQFKFAASGATPPGGSGTVFIQGWTGRGRSVIVSSAGRVRLE